MLEEKNNKHTIHFYTSFACPLFEVRLNLFCFVFFKKELKKDVSNVDMLPHS